MKSNFIGQTTIVNHPVREENCDVKRNLQPATAQATLLSEVREHDFVGNHKEVSIDIQNVHKALHFSKDVLRCFKNEQAFKTNALLSIYNTEFVWNSNNGQTNDWPVVVEHDDCNDNSQLEIAQMKENPEQVLDNNYLIHSQSGDWYSSKNDNLFMDEMDDCLGPQYDIETNYDPEDDFYYTFNGKIVTHAEKLALFAQGHYVITHLRLRGGGKTDKKTNPKRTIVQKQEDAKLQKQHVKTVISKKKDNRNYKIIVKRAIDNELPIVKKQPEPKLKTGPKIDIVDKSLVVSADKCFNFGKMDLVLPPPPPPPVPDMPEDLLPPPIPDWPFKVPEWRFKSVPIPEDPPAPELFDLTMKTFEYQITITWCFWFTFRRTMVGSLPKAIIMELVPKISKLNAVELMNWESLLCQNPVFLKYHAYYLKSSVKEADDFKTMCLNLWYSYAKTAEHKEALSSANSIWSEARRTQSNQLAKRSYVTTDYWEQLIVPATKWTLILCGLVFLYAKGKKTIQPYLLDNCEHMVNTLRGGTKHTLFSSFPRFSVYLEESIKMVPYGWWIISVLERCKYGNWKTYKWHKMSMRWNYPTRVKKHFEINGPLSELKLIYTAFVEKDTPPQYPEIIEEIDDWTMPARSLPKIENNEPRNFATIDEPTNRKDFHIPQVWYTLMWGVSTMLKPGNTYENQQASIYERVNKHENTETLLTEQVKFCELTKQVSLEHTDNDSFYESLTARQKLNLKKSQQQIDNGTVPQIVTAQIKGDELINGKIKSAPRFLCNLSGVEFYQTGKITSEITHWLAEENWNFRGEGKLTLGNTTLHPYLTCGATSRLIDTFIKNALDSQTDIWQLLMGDDTLALDRNRNCVIENDFSRYDRTQNDFLLSVPNTILCNNGYSELVQFRKDQYKKTIKFKKNGKCTAPLSKLSTPSKRKPQMRMTGESGTCLDNSINNAFATLIACEIHDSKPQTIVDNYKKCGLIAKTKITPTVYGATFLKGVFLEGTDGNPHWIRLPSWICKFGKILTDPMTIIKKKNEKRGS
jgi:hypothetical protein